MSDQTFKDAFLQLRRDDHQWATHSLRRAAIRDISRLNERFQDKLTSQSQQDQPSADTNILDVLKATAK